MLFFCFRPDFCCSTFYFFYIQMDGGAVQKLGVDLSRQKCQNTKTHTKPTNLRRPWPPPSCLLRRPSYSDAPTISHPESAFVLQIPYLVLNNFFRRLVLHQQPLYAPSRCTNGHHSMYAIIIRQEGGDEG